jgi:hypothetical protein
VETLAKPVKRLFEHGFQHRASIEQSIEINPASIYTCSTQIPSATVPLAASNYRGSGVNLEKLAHGSIAQLRLAVKRLWEHTAPIVTTQYRVRA